MSKVDLRPQCGMPCSKLEVSTAQHGTLSGAGYLHQSRHSDRSIGESIERLLDRDRESAGADCGQRCRSARDRPVTGFSPLASELLKEFGVAAQREVETAARQAIPQHRLKGSERLHPKLTLSIPAVGLTHGIEGDVDLG